MKAIIFVTLALLLACSASAAAEEEVFSRTLLATKTPKMRALKLFKVWNDALLTGNPETVANKYARGAVLLPTVSPKEYIGQGQIEKYFVNFLKLDPSGKIITMKAWTDKAGWTTASGEYDFDVTYDGVDRSVVHARYTFVWNNLGKIVTHHSSKIPEA